MSSELQVAYDTLRANLQAELDSQLTSLKNVIDRQERRQNLDPSRSVLSRLPKALREIGGASSVTAKLDALADAVSAEARRTAILVVSGPDERPTLECWRSDGFDEEEDRQLPRLLAGAVQTHQVPEALASSQQANESLVVPLVVGDRSVALLYAEWDSSDPEAAAVQPVLQILAAHASACLSHVTALRLLQTLAPAFTPPRATGEQDEGARRYARLLVSEIKLYNESAVRAGRERRDLLLRLRPEIDRARRLYEERVPASVGDRATLFQQELVETLAEGDATLLGVPA